MKQKIFLKLFAVVDCNEPATFLTICSKQKDAIEYVKKYLIYLHFDHFLSWCELHKYNTSDDKAQETYLNSCIGMEELERYSIKKLAYSKDNILSIIRMFCGCVPIGCSFESDVELTYMQSKQEQFEILRDTLKNLQPQESEDQTEDVKQ